MEAKTSFKASLRVSKRDIPALLGVLKPAPLVPAKERFLPYEGAKVDFDENLTTNSPVKTEFMPDGGASFRFDFAKKRVLPQGKEPAKIIFGVNPLDIRALDILDGIFLAKFPAYAARRKAATVVGAGDFGKSGASFDLFLHDEGLDYLAIAGSEKGRALLSRHKKFFRKGEEKTVQRGEKPAWDPTLKGDMEDLRKAVKNADPSVWEKVATEQLCLGCGICSYVCPLCYCFEVEDGVPPGAKAGARCSRWDSCMLASFTEVAGGHVFQNALPLRIRNWYYHKFARATSERGTPDCVGCNRCFHFCPVAINFREVLKNAAANPRKG